MSSQAVANALGAARGDEEALRRARNFGRATAGLAQAEIVGTQASTESYRRDLANQYSDKARGLERDAWDARNHGNEDGARELEAEARDYRNTASDHRRRNEQ